MQIEALRESIKQRLSEKRYRHSLGVEQCAARLANMCLREFDFEVRAAALLHDITKELSRDAQIAIINNAGLVLSSDELQCEQFFHSLTAPFVIRRDYPEFARENILSAVKNHTVGDTDMSIFDEIIFLADFIEEGREYAPSRELYEYVFSNMRESELENNVQILHKAALKSIDYTIGSLILKNKPIIIKTVLTRNALLSKILHI